MAWFNDIQKGIYDIVGMIDPSDPGYQGMMKAQQMDMVKKQIAEATLAQQLKNDIPYQAIYGNARPGAEDRFKGATTNSALGQLRDNMAAGQKPNEWAGNNALAMIFGGVQPAEMPWAINSPQDVSTMAKYNGKLLQTPQELASLDINEKQLQRQDKQTNAYIDNMKMSRDLQERGLNLQDKWHANSNQISREAMAARQHGATQTYDANAAQKDWDDYSKFLTNVTKITGGTENNPGMSVDVAANHILSNQLTWAPQVARMIKAGVYSYDRLVNDLSASITNGGAGLTPESKARAEQLIQEITSKMKSTGKGQGYAINPNFAGRTQSFMDAISREMGLKGDMTSGYRDPEYNAEVGGVPDSLHTKGLAVDYAFPGITPEQKARLLSMAKTYGFMESLFHDVGSGEHLHLGG